MSAASDPGKAPAAGRAKWLQAGSWLAWLEQRMNLTELFSFVTHFGLIYTPVDTHRPLR